MESNGKCFLCITESKITGYWVLGSAFMRGYYVTHDYDTLKFGFVPQAGSTKSVPVVGLVPEQEGGGGIETWVYVVIIIVCTVIALFAALTIAHYCLLTLMAATNVNTRDYSSTIGKGNHSASDRGATCGHSKKGDCNPTLVILINDSRQETI